MSDLEPRKIIKRKPLESQLNKSSPAFECGSLSGSAKRSQSEAVKTKRSKTQWDLESDPRKKPLPFAIEEKAIFEATLFKELYLKLMFDNLICKYMK